MELILETSLYILGTLVTICLIIVFVGAYLVVKNSIQCQLLLIISIIEVMLGISIHEQNAEHLALSILALAGISALWIFTDEHDRMAKVCLLFLGTVVAVLAGVFTT